MRAASIAAVLALAVGLAALSRGEAPRATSPGAIAHFDFREGTHDLSDEGKATAVLKDTKVVDGNLVLNGVYGHEDMTGSGYAAKFKVPKLDYGRFTVAWRFKARDFDVTTQLFASELHVVTDHRNLLVGGDTYRWMSFMRMESGVVRFALNNGGNDDFHLGLKGTNVKLNVWTTIACSFDLEKRTAIVAVDGVVAPIIRLPADLKLRVMSAPRDVDRLFTFTNYANGMTLSGEVSELIVYPHAMSEAEVKGLKLSGGEVAGK